MNLLAVTALALTLPLLGTAPAAPSAEQFYAHAVERVRLHDVPAFATYDASVSGLNCIIKSGNLECGLGKGTPESKAPLWADLRASDGRLALRRAGASVVIDDSTFLNPTWPGVDRLITHGFTGTVSAPSPAPLASQPPSALPVIAVVSALSVAHYEIYDAGASTCSNGNAAHAVRLVARHDPLRYPMTGATVDMTTGDLCAVRFNARISAAAGLVGVTGGAQLDLENVAGYEVVANERFDIDLRAIGVAVKHLNVNVAYSDFTFPKTIAPEIFATPPPSPTPHSHQ